MSKENGTKEDSLGEMFEDLRKLMEKYIDVPVEIYCANCDCSDKYTGATGYIGSGFSKIQITINRG